MNQMINRAWAVARITRAARQTVMNNRYAMGVNYTRNFMWQNSLNTRAFSTEVDQDNKAKFQGASEQDVDIPPQEFAKMKENLKKFA